MVLWEEGEAGGERALLRAGVLPNFLAQRGQARGELNRAAYTPMMPVRSMWGAQACSEGLQLPLPSAACEPARRLI